MKAGDCEKINELIVGKNKNSEQLENDFRKFVGSFIKRESPLSRPTDGKFIACIWF